MRRFAGVVVVSILVSVAVPVHARATRDGGTWLDRAHTTIAKFINRFSTKAFGDLATIPRP